MNLRTNIKHDVKLLGHTQTVDEIIKDILAALLGRLDLRTLLVVV
jgi:hypothetical protein